MKDLPSEGKEFSVEAPYNIANGSYVDTDWPNKSALGVSEREHSERRHQICNYRQVVGFSLEILQRSAERPKDFLANVDLILDMAVDTSAELKAL